MSAATGGGRPFGRARRATWAPVETDDITSVATDASFGVPQTEALRAVAERSEAVRLAELELRRHIDERNASIREAIDVYLVSHRRVARASGLSLGRIHGILAND